MLCRGEAGEFRHSKGREVCSVEAGGARSGELWYCEARRGAASQARCGALLQGLSGHDFKKRRMSTWEMFTHGDHTNSV